MTAKKCLEFVGEAVSTLIKAYEEAENMTASVTAIRGAIKILEDLKIADFRGPEAVE